MYWDGELVGTLSGEGRGLSNTDWSTHIFQVEACNETGRIEFRAAGTADNVGGYIDDVQLRESVVQTEDLELSIAASDQPENYIANGSFQNTGDVEIRNNGWAGLQELSGWEMEVGERFEVVDYAREASGHEQAKWEAFSDGEVIASGTFVAEDSNAGTVSIDLLEGVTADKIAITPTEYSGGQNGSVLDSSDFFLKTINVDTIASPHVSTVAGTPVGLGTDSLEKIDVEKSTLTVSGLPQGAILNVGTDNGDGT